MQWDGYHHILFQEFLFSDIRNFANGQKNIPFDPDVIIALECFEHINEFDIPHVIEWIASLNCPCLSLFPMKLGQPFYLKTLGISSICVGVVSRIGTTLGLYSHKQQV